MHSFSSPFALYRLCLPFLSLVVTLVRPFFSHQADKIDWQRRGRRRDWITDADHALSMIIQVPTTQETPEPPTLTAPSSLVALSASPTSTTSTMSPRRTLPSSRSSTTVSVRSRTRLRSPPQCLLALETSASADGVSALLFAESLSLTHCPTVWLANNGTGNFYMTAFDCKVTGATSTAKIAAPVDPTWCDPAEYKAGTCKIPGGAKRPLYAYNSESNIVWKGNWDRPGYVSSRALFSCRHRS